jgi:hypothetical protein
MAKAVLIVLPKARTEGDQCDVRVAAERPGELIGVSFAATQQVDVIGGVGREDERNSQRFGPLPKDDRTFTNSAS